MRGGGEIQLLFFYKNHAKTRECLCSKIRVNQRRATAKDNFREIIP
jgi:hypothetical protein